MGLTNSMTRLPGFARLLAAVIRTVAPGVSFTTVALFTQGNVGPHRDINNIPNSNVLYPICLPKPGMYVWSQLQMGDQLSGPVEVRAVPGGELQAGQVRWLREREPLQLNAKSWHSAQVLGQSRVLLLVSYSLLAINKTTAEHKATLSEFGFVLPGPSATQLCLAISEDDADDAHQGGEGGMLEEGARHVEARHPPISKTWNHDSAFEARHPPISKTWNHDSAFEARHPPISKTWNHDSAFEARHPPISKTWNHDSAFEARHAPISKTWNHDSAFEARHPPISKTWFRVQACACMDRGCMECMPFFAVSPEGEYVAADMLKPGERLCALDGGRLVEAPTWVVDGSAETAQAVQGHDVSAGPDWFDRVFGVGELGCLLRPLSCVDTCDVESRMIASELPLRAPSDDCLDSGHVLVDADLCQRGLKALLSREARQLKGELSGGENSTDAAETAQLMTSVTEVMQQIEQELTWLRACKLEGQMIPSTSDADENACELPQFLQTRTFTNEEVMAEWMKIGKGLHKPS